MPKEPRTAAKIVLESERMLFRHHELSDLNAYCAMEADPEVRRYVGGEPRSREAAEQKYREVFLRPVTDRMRLWATVFKPEDCFIGYCGIYPHYGHEGPISGEGVLAFYLARPYWGRGLATEAGRAFVAFGFSELKLARIVAGAAPENVASIRVLQKLGFVPVATGEGDFELWSPEH